MAITALTVPKDWWENYVSVDKKSIDWHPLDEFEFLLNNIDFIER